MLNVAIVEDTPQDALTLSEQLKRYGREKNIAIEQTVFKNALIFLQNYKGEYDIVFMDIDMPVLNGMNAARCLREVDQHVMLILP